MLSVKKIFPFKSLVPITRVEFFGLFSEIFELDFRLKKMSKVLLKFKKYLLMKKIPKKHLVKYKELTINIMKQDLNKYNSIKDDRIIFLSLLLRSGYVNECIEIIEKIRELISLRSGDQSAVIFFYKTISFLSMLLQKKNMPVKIIEIMNSFTNKNYGYIGKVFACEFDNPVDSLDLFFIGSSPFIRQHVDLVEKINFNSKIAVNQSPETIERMLKFFYFGMLEKESIKSVVDMISVWIWSPYFQSNKKIIQSIKNEIGFPEEYYLLIEIIDRIHYLGVKLYHDNKG